MRVSVTITVGEKKRHEQISNSVLARRLLKYIIWIRARAFKTNTRLPAGPKPGDRFPPPRDDDPPGFPHLIRKYGR